MDKTPSTNKLRTLKIDGEVGAGRLLPFATPAATITVAIPESISDNELLGVLTVRGRSLEDEGIFDGDLLVCKKATFKRQIGPNTICIVYIPATGEVVAKKIRFSEDKWLLLKGCGGGVPDMRVSAEEVEIRGIVISFVRELDRSGRFGRQDDTDIPF